MARNRIRTALGIALALVGLGLITAYLLRDYNVTSGYDSTPFKFALVCLTLATSIAYFFLEPHSKATALWLVLALTFTLCADVFLLLLDNYYEVGIGFFIAAQLCHFAHVYRLGGKRYVHLVVSLCMRAGASVAVGVSLFALGYGSVLNILAGIYASNLLANTVESVLFLFRKYGDIRCFICLAIGFLLFVGCDVFVGLNFLGQGDYRLMWLFYGPSQVLICLSGNFVHE